MWRLSFVRHMYLLRDPMDLEAASVEACTVQGSTNLSRQRRQSEFCLSSRKPSGADAAAFNLTIRPSRDVIDSSQSKNSQAVINRK